LLSASEAIEQVRHLAKSLSTGRPTFPNPDAGPIPILARSLDARIVLGNDDLELLGHRRGVGATNHCMHGNEASIEERAIIEQIASWIEEAMWASTAMLTEQMDAELERGRRNETGEADLPRPRPDGVLAGLPHES
jgi:hypothetical protein